MVLWLGSFYYRSKMPKDLFEELLQFVGIATKKTDGPLCSFYKFEKYLEQHAPLEKMDSYVFCPACKIPKKKEEWNGCDTCHTIKTSVKLINEGHYFVMCSIERALRNVFELRENEMAILEYREKLNSSPSVNIRDVMDTWPYKEIACKYQAITDQSIPFTTLTINLDAAEKHKTSLSSVYPLMLAINELPPFLRGSYIIIPFVFQRDDEIDFDDKYLTPLIAEFNRLAREGFKWRSSLTGNIEKTYVLPFNYIMDAMMKPKLLGITHPSGYNSCPNCFVTGVWVQKGKGGSVVYLSTDTGCLEKRTEDNCIIDSRGQLSKPALLSMEGNRDLFKMVPIDPMHNVYIGNVKYLIKNIIFNKSAMGKANRNVADSILGNTRPTDFIERGPRKFTEMAFWRAHEWANFLYYYSLAIFEELVDRGLMKREVMDHWVTLIQGIALINSREISRDDVIKGGRLIYDYHVKMPQIHGEGCCTYNLHATTHMAGLVNEHGPLWAVAMFMYESFNSTVLNSSNGTQYVPLQIAERLSLKRPLQILHQKVEESYPNSFSVEQTVFRRSKKGTLLKKKSKKPITSQEQELFQAYFVMNLVPYDTVTFNGVDFSTWSHDTRPNAALKMNCYIFVTHKQIYGQIKRIFVDSGSIVYLLCYEMTGEPSLLRHGMRKAIVTTNIFIERVVDHCIIKCIKVKNTLGVYLMQKINDCKGS